MNLRFVIYSDIQFCEWPEFSKILPNGLNSRFQDQLNVQDEIFNFAKQQKETGEVVVIHNGDLFESMTEKINKQFFLTVYEKFVQYSKEDIPIILLVGNHDWLDKTEKRHIIQPFKEIENVIVVDNEWRVEFLKNISLGFIPYTKGNFLDRIKEIKKQVKGIEHKYLFTHQGISGAMVGPRDIFLKEEFSITDFGIDAFDLIFNGHYHKAQSLGSHNAMYSPKFIIIGSPLQKDFGERNDTKGFLFLDTDIDPKKPKFIKTNGPKFHKNTYEKLDEIFLPLDYKEEDFLWVISSILKEDEIKGRLIELGINMNKVRIDIEEEKQRKIRTNISLNMTIEQQMRKAVRYILEQNKIDLDENKLIEMAMDKYRISLEV